MFVCIIVINFHRCYFLWWLPIPANIKLKVSIRKYSHYTFNIEYFSKLLINVEIQIRYNIKIIFEYLNSVKYIPNVIFSSTLKWIFFFAFFDKYRGFMNTYSSKLGLISKIHTMSFSAKQMKRLPHFRR